MKLKENHLPLYLKLYWKLKDDIQFMELSPGERMPTVEELHKLYGVSQGTVRKTLELLEKDGLISKKRGLGVSVRDDIKVPTPNPSESGDEYRSRIQLFDYQTLSKGWVEASKRIRVLFENQVDVFQDNQIYQLQILMMHQEDHRRKNYVIIYVPAWLMSQTGEENINSFVKEGLVQFNGIKSVRIASELRPWICNAEIGEILDVAEGSAMFRRLYIHYSTDNRILALVESFPTASASIREMKITW